MNVRHLDKQTILAAKEARPGQQSAASYFRDEMMREVIYMPRFWTVDSATESYLTTWDRSRCFPDD